MRSGGQEVEVSTQTGYHGLEHIDNTGSSRDCADSLSLTIQVGVPTRDTDAAHGP